MTLIGAGLLINFAGSPVLTSYFSFATGAGAVIATVAAVRHGAKAWIAAALGCCAASVAAGASGMMIVATLAGLTILFGMGSNVFEQDNKPTKASPV